MKSLEQYLSNALMDMGALKVFHFDTIDSTNTFAMTIAPYLQQETAVVVADSQSEGRGRRGNKWVSPKGNLYMSIVLKDLNPIKAITCQWPIINMITLMAGIAVVDAIEQTCGYRTSLKWPNDIMAENNKIGGLLAESRFEGGRLNFIVIGIGINIIKSELPLELRNKSASLSECCPKGSISRDDLAANIARYIILWYKCLTSGQSKRILTEWNLRSSTLNRRVKVINDEGITIVGTAQGLDDMGRIIIKTAPDNYTHIGSGSLFYT